MRRFDYRLDVTKLDEAGFLSHSDFIRVISRGLVRSTLPVHTSGGHRWPSPKISVMHPLPTGVESEQELVTFKLCSYHTPSRIRKRMDPIPFPGLEIIDVIPLSSSSGPSIREMTFRIRFDEPVPDSIFVRRDRQDGTGNGDVQNTSSVPEQLIELELSDRTCVYRTGSDKGHLHPKSVLDWIRNHTDETLPPVRQMIKTDIVTER